MTPQEMAQAVLDYIELHPEGHDQDSWFGVGEDGCGTTMCVAGTACYLVDGSEARKRLDGNPFYALNRGRELLGLDHEDACALFYDSDNEQALLGLRYLAKGEPLPFKMIGSE